MIEITTTRTNPLVDPALHVWGWEIPVYLFLGGLVAGNMVIAGWLMLTDRRRAGSVTHVLPGVSLALMSLGMLALFLDLERKVGVWRLYATFRPASPMSWGAWILLAVYPVLAAALLLRPPPGLRARLPSLSAVADALGRHPRAGDIVAGASTALGGLLGIYTGLLLGTMGARPLWNSAMLGPLFLASGLSSGAALAHLLARDHAERELLARADHLLLQAELVLLALFLVGLLTSTAVHVRAASTLMGGPYTAVFWTGVVGLGLMGPLLLQSLAAARRVRHTRIAPLSVMAGGLLLRFVIVNAGQASGWGPR